MAKIDELKFDDKEIKDEQQEKHKNEIVSKLQTIYSCANLKPHECEWILQAIDYIKEMGDETNF